MHNLGVDIEQGTVVQLKDGQIEPLTDNSPFNTTTRPRIASNNRPQLMDQSWTLFENRDATRYDNNNGLSPSVGPSFYSRPLFSNRQSPEWSDK